MRNNFVALLFLCVLTPAFSYADGVTVYTPANNETVSSPFALQASSTSCYGQPVVAMAYSFGNGDDSPAVYDTSLNTLVTLGLGTQVIHVKSWGNQGAGCDADVTVNVVQSGVTVSTPSNGATVSAPFTLQATSGFCAGQPVAAMAYSIGDGGDSQAVNSNSLNTQVNAPTGSQVIHVKSWGNQGAGCDADVTVNVVQSGVTVSTPSNGATVSAPFTLQATSGFCAGQPVAAMAYSIGSGVDSQAVNSTSLNTQVNAPAGIQTIHVKSWGNQGAGCDTDVAVNVIPSGGVTVTTPVNGAWIQTSFNLQATSTWCQGQPVAAMAYSIGSGADSPAVNSTSLNTTVTASIGAGQLLHVKSWGNQGAGCDTDVAINVQGFAGSMNIPQPPGTAMYANGIQNLSGWSTSTGAVSQCPNGVASPTCNPVSANYNPTVVQTGDPAPLSGSDGTAGEFELYQSPAYATAIWGRSVYTNTSAQNFIWDFYVYVNSSTYGDSELDLYTSLNGGQRFMMGTQCNRAANSWDTWSEADQQWIHNTNIPCNSVLTPWAWHHVTFYNTVNPSNNTYTYQVVRIDGVDYMLNQTQSAQYVGWPDGLIGVQVQLDADSLGNGVDEVIENMQLYSW